MSTLQATKMSAKAQQMKNWAAIFPPEQVTEQRSALFVKKLLAVAISNITYLRNIFPEKAFGDKCLDDLNLKILRDESTCPGACQVITWVKGCFDALEKKYLKTLVIGIYVDPNDPETVIESYTFKFSYENDGSVDIYRNEKKISGAYSTEETKKATIKLLRTLIILTNTLTSLPNNVMMTMKLYYYDDVTPKDYEPPGFKAAIETGFNFEEDASNIAIGSVSTSFHTVRLRIKTSKREFDMPDESEETNSIVTVTDTPLDKEHEIDVQPENDQSELNSEADPMAVDKDEADPMAVDKDDFKVRCPCGCNEDDGIMVMCEICKFWQHGTCFLVTSPETAPETHICDICGKPNDPQLEPTDPQLCGMPSIEVQAICLWRRVLSIVTQFKRITTPLLASRLDIEHTVAQGLINRLEKEGFISTKKGKGQKKGLGKVVNKEKIEEEGVPKYLEPPKEDVSTKMENKIENMETIGIEKDINTLTDVTKNMNLGNRRNKRTKNSPQVNSQVENTNRRARKRTHSRINVNEFEPASPEIDDVAAKKASKVKQDIIL